MVGTERNRLGGDDLSFLCAPALHPALAVGLSGPVSLYQKETKAVERRRSISMLVQAVQNALH